MSFNEHTGDKLQSKVPTDEYRDNWDRIFKPAKSLDAAYQRKAIDEGWTFEESALFEENKEYLKAKRASKSS